MRAVFTGRSRCEDLAFRFKVLYSTCLLLKFLSFPVNPFPSSSSSSFVWETTFARKKRREKKGLFILREKGRIGCPPKMPFRSDNPKRWRRTIEKSKQFVCAIKDKLSWENPPFLQFSPLQIAGLVAKKECNFFKAKVLTRYNPPLPCSRDFRVKQCSSDMGAPLIRKGRERVSKCPSFPPPPPPLFLKEGEGGGGESRTYGLHPFLLYSFSLDPFPFISERICRYIIYRPSASKTKTKSEDEL